MSPYRCAQCLYIAILGRTQAKNVLNAHPSRHIGPNGVPDLPHYPLHRSQFEKAYGQGPLTGPGQLNDLVRGPSYVYAILTDPRVRAYSPR